MQIEGAQTLDYLHPATERVRWLSRDEVRVCAIAIIGNTAMFASSTVYAGSFRMRLGLDSTLQIAATAFGLAVWPGLMLSSLLPSKRNARSAVLLRTNALLILALNAIVSIALLDEWCYWMDRPAVSGLYVVLIVLAWLFQQLVRARRWSYVCAVAALTIAVALLGTRVHRCGHMTLVQVFHVPVAQVGDRPCHNRDFRHVWDIAQFR